MPSYSYRCDERYCGEISWWNGKEIDRPVHIKCQNCGSHNTHRVILNSPMMKRVLTALGPTRMKEER